MEQTGEETTHQVNIKAPEFMETAVNEWFTILEAMGYTFFLVLK